MLSRKEKRPETMGGMIGLVARTLHNLMENLRNCLPFMQAMRVMWLFAHQSSGCMYTHTHKHTIHILSFGSDQFTGKMLSPLRRQTIPRKMCDLNRESGSRSLQTLMTGSAIVRGVNGKETHASHIHHYHDHPPEEEKDER